MITVEIVKTILLPYRDKRDSNTPQTTGSERLDRRLGGLTYQKNSTGRRRRRRIRLPVGPAALPRSREIRSTAAAPHDAQPTLTVSMTTCVATVGVKRLIINNHNTHEPWSRFYRKYYNFKISEVNILIY